MKKKVSKIKNANKSKMTLDKFAAMVMKQFDKSWSEIGNLRMEILGHRKDTSYIQAQVDKIEIDVDKIKSDVRMLTFQSKNNSELAKEIDFINKKLNKLTETNTTK